MRLELTEPQASLVFRILRNRMDELRVEVRHEHDSDARRYLKHKESLLRDVLQKLGDVDEHAHQVGYRLPGIAIR